MTLAPGTYVVAVSGGVDSTVLLHMLQKVPDVQLIVAHYDHGIRPDSTLDRELVQHLAAQYSLPFQYEEGMLGADTSEATARRKRYDFLERIRRHEQARAIITAHHQDDLIETAILNVLRGTGRKGLTSLQSSELLLRPLLPYTKAELHAYASKHNLQWREDTTNADERYLRNYIRRQLLPKFTPETRVQLLELIECARTTNQTLDRTLDDLLGSQMAANELDRKQFVQLPHRVAKEVLASWLRSHHLADFDAPTLERVTVAAKVQAPGTIIDLMHGAQLCVDRNKLALRYIER